MPGRAARRIEPHRIHRQGVGCRPRGVHEALGRAVGHRHAVAEGREVVGGDRRSHLVGVDRGDLESERGEPQRVAADAAAEVRDARHAGVAEARGVAPGDREARRLLEAGAGEQHPLGELAELRARPRPQPGLRDDGRHEVGGVTVLAQPRHRPRHVVGGVDRRQSVEQPQALGGEQRGQLGQIHPVSLWPLPPIDPRSGPADPHRSPRKPRGDPRCRFRRPTPRL